VFELTILNDQLKSPLELVIEVTDFCNLSCSYCFCYNENSIKCPRKTIPFDKLKTIINEANDLDIFEICISGGECFLRNDIFEIFDHIIKKNMNFSIVTNGTLLGKKEIKQLDERSIITNLQISIDSHIPEIHNIVRGKYKETLNAINLINSLTDDKPILGSVIHKENYSTFAGSLRFFSTKCSNFHLMNVQASKRALENNDLLFVDSNRLAEFWNNIQKVSLELPINVDIYENDLKPLETARFTGCTAGKTKLVVNSNLDIIPCDITRNIILGDLTSQSLSDIWISKERKEIGKAIKEPCHKLNLEWYKEKLDTANLNF